MCCHWLLQTQSMAFHAFTIISKFLLKQIDVFSVPKPIKEAIVSVYFLKIPVSPRTYQSCYMLILLQGYQHK